MATVAISVDIGVNSEVHCLDGASGRCDAITINPVSRTISAIVVKYEREKFIVPVRYVAITTPDLIVLNCTRIELKSMSRYYQESYLNVTIPDFFFDGDYYVDPYVEKYGEAMILQKLESVPPGEVAIKRGNEVIATDGRVGTVDEFAVEKESGNITHIILREGHLWQKQDISVPIKDVERVSDNSVYLKIDKESIGSLPSVRVERWWE